MVRRFNPATGADPYHSLQVADIGDVGINLYDLKDSCRRIREAYRRIVAGGCIPLTLGKPSRGRAVGLACAKQRAPVKWRAVPQISAPGKEGAIIHMLFLDSAGGDHTITYPILQALAEK